MDVTLKELNTMYNGIVEAVEKIGYHPNRIFEPIGWENSVKDYAVTTRDARFEPVRYYIRISKVLTDAESDPVRIYETIAHEVIHCVDGCMKHTGRWKEIVQRFNAAYGTHITRTCSAPKSYTENAPYKIACEKCGNTIGYARMCKSVKHPELYSCGRCGGDFKRVA